MDQSVFDRATQAFAASPSRRRLLGLLGGAAVATVLGDDPDQAAARKQHGRNRAHRPGRRKKNRKGKLQGRGSSVWLRGIKMTVANPLTNPGQVAVEFGTSDAAPEACCQAEETYTLEPGETRWWATRETDAYLWAGNKDFISLINPTLGLPFLSAGLNGTPGFSPNCCKPVGQTLLYHYGLDVGETRTVDFGGHDISIKRLADEDDYKSFYIIL